MALVKIYYLMPSVAVLVAAFVPKPSTGDVSDLLRRDYTSESIKVKVRVKGKLGALRSHIPWARPANPIVSAATVFAAAQKRTAVKNRIGDFQDSCSNLGYWKISGPF
jgi:hypothetical protein